MVALIWRIGTIPGDDDESMRPFLFALLAAIFALTVVMPVSLMWLGHFP